MTERIQQIRGEQALIQEKADRKKAEGQLERERKRAEFDAYGNQLVTLVGTDLMAEFNEAVFEGRGSITLFAKDVTYRTGSISSSNKRTYRASGAKVGTKLRSVFVGIVNPASEKQDDYTEDFTHPKFIVTSDPDLGKAAWERISGGLANYGSLDRSHLGNEEFSESLIVEGRLILESKLVEIAERFIRSPFRE